MLHYFFNNTEFFQYAVPNGAFILLCLSRYASCTLINIKHFKIAWNALVWTYNKTIDRNKVSGPIIIKATSRLFTAILQKALRTVERSGGHFLISYTSCLKFELNAYLVTYLEINKGLLQVYYFTISMLTTSCLK